MRGAFDDEEIARPAARRDTELTLGSGLLLALLLGLVLLCSACFGLGYYVGHRGPQTAPVATDAQAAVQPSGSSQKPGATPQTQPAPPVESADSEQAAAQEPADAAPPQPAGQPVTQSVAQSITQSVTQPAAQVRPAFGSAGSAGAVAPQPAQTPAPAAGTLMVQIAAVSNSEDADVLTSALRKRGYTVTEKRDPGDNLIHVRIGPFATAAEANGWKMKLLNDGYNAVVQP